MTVLKGEIKVVMAVLEEADAEVEIGTPDSELSTLDEIATRIIESLDEYRARKPAFVNLVMVSPDHWKTQTFFVQGWYKSQSIAKQKSGGLFPPGSNLSISWLTVQMVKDFRKEVLAHFKGDDELSAWAEGEVPADLIREVRFAEPVTSEEE